MNMAYIFRGTMWNGEESAGVRPGVRSHRVEVLTRSPSMNSLSTNGPPKSLHCLGVCWASCVSLSEAKSEAN